MTATGYTVGDLAAFLRDLSEVPGLARRTIADTRYSVDQVLRALDLTPDTVWDTQTINRWCEAYATTVHATRLTPHSLITYQGRLRTAARWFHLAHTQPRWPNPPAAPQDKPRPLDESDDSGDSDVVRLGSANRDIQLLAKAWDVTTTEVIIKMVDFYRTHNTGSESSSAHATTPGEDVDVHAFYDYTRVTGVFHRRDLSLSITSGPLTGQWFRSPHSAATAVVHALRPHVTRPNRNGWDFWRINGEMRKLRSIRPD
jgi:hypothetical protein